MKVFYYKIFFIDKNLNKIHHPDIVKLFCIIETDREIFIIMEYIKSNKLFKYILVRKK